MREVLFYLSFQCENSNDNLLQSLQNLTLEPNNNLSELANEILQQNQLQPIVIVTPELGKWSTVGGLGVMVDNLSKALAKQGQEVIVISPYYDRNRYGQTE